jgi:hypothetical protein
MTYQNQYDKTGAASVNGARAEEKFKQSIETFFGATVTDASLSEQYSHIDFTCDVNFKVDVKSMKDPNTVWIEFKNVRGDDGWLYGEATHFAFERHSCFLVVEKSNLISLVDSKVDMQTVVDKAEDCLYKVYSRPNRKDLLTKLRPTDLTLIPYFLITKFK